MFLVLSFEGLKNSFLPWIDSTAEPNLYIRFKEDWYSSTILHEFSSFKFIIGAAAMEQLTVVLRFSQQPNTVGSIKLWNTKTTFKLAYVEWCCFKAILLLKYRMSHETWQLVNSLECRLPYVLLLFDTKENDKKYYTAVILK